MNLSIIIPAYNEEETVEATVRDVLSQVIVPSFELIVVADHCTDRTEEIVRHIAVADPRVRLIVNDGERGFGNTVICGYRAAVGEAVVPLMADHCDNPATINHMWELLRSQGADVVCASRYMKGGSKRGGPFLQDKLSRIVCFTLHVLTRIPTTDCANSYKMYRREFLFSLPYDIRGAGTEYSMALIFKAYFVGGRIVEVPTAWIGGSIPLSDEWKILRRFRKYRYWYVQAVRRWGVILLSGHRSQRKNSGVADMRERGE
jgi:glycosyltransferase involved in cell wall biosynthesis